MQHEQIQYLPTSSVEVEANIREELDPAAMRGLAVTLRRVGQLSPIRVRREGDRLIVVDGHRRLEAARLVGLAEIAAIIEEKSLNSGDVIERQLISACQQEDLKPLEKARAIKRLMDSSGWANGVVAARLGLSAGAVSRLLALLDLPEAIQEDVESGKIPASAGYKLSHVNDEQERAALAQQVADGKLTRDGLNAAVKGKRQPRRPRKRREPTPRMTASLGSGRSVTVSGPELSLGNVVEWLDDLLARARRALAENVELKAFVHSLREPQTA
jgi:ParB/RepB/Spo0J family partition protein